MRRFRDIEHLPTHVYRLYDQADRLLYVGVTLNLESRIASHISGMPWGGDIHRIEVKEYPNRVLAEAAERAAIDSESPIHNKHRGFANTPAAVARRLIADAQLSGIVSDDAKAGA